MEEQNNSCNVCAAARHGAKYVRTEDEYKSLFDDIGWRDSGFDIRDDLNRVPYHHIIFVGGKDRIG
jgi:hypothetical protein